jgi:hypothetical protein
MKPKKNRKGSLRKSSSFDRCQTPAYAIDPLIQFLNEDWIIWECAAGEGNIVNYLSSKGYKVIGTDILTGQNFFEWEPDQWDCIVTNPPYSIKYQWLEHCYDLGKPFALLLPVETIGAASGQRLFEEYGCEIIFLNKRVDFKMPGRTYRKSSAQFPVAWFTWKMKIGKAINFHKIVKREDRQMWFFEMN